MAGESQKSTALTNRDSNIVRASRLAKGKMVVARDTHQFAAATELEAADNLILDIRVPSNAIVDEISIKNDDLDTGCSPTLVLDIGVAAAEDYTSTTSGTDTKHKKDDIIDADLLVDGSTEGQSANAVYTTIGMKTAAGSSDKAVWELLGYDSDPNTTFNIVVQSQAASSALGSAGDLDVRVIYAVD